MTKEDKLKAYEMRLNGATYREIADSFGVSYQYIQQILPMRRDIEIKGIYVGIKKWMKENRFNFVDFAGCAMPTITPFTVR